MSECKAKSTPDDILRAVALAKLEMMARCPGCSDTKRLEQEVRTLARQCERLRKQLNREDGISPCDAERAAGIERREMRLIHRTVDNEAAS